MTKQKKGLDYAKDQVEQFHLAFGHLIAEKPTAIPVDIAVPRINWTAEELVEFLYATAGGNIEQFNELFKGLVSSMRKTAKKMVTKADPIEDILVSQMDALTDINYFVQGSFVTAGINPQPLFDIVQDANMAKLFPDGEPRFDAKNGNKIIKPDGWEAPEPKLKEEIKRQGQANPHGTKFKVGDKVIVKRNLDIEQTYTMECEKPHEDSAVTQMAKFRGNEVTISSIELSYPDRNKFYHIEEDNGEWNWTDGMFE